MSASLGVALRVRGAIGALSDDDRRRLFDRTTSCDEGVRAATAEIIRDVRTHKDAALRRLARRFDRADLDTLEVPREKLARALATLDPALRAPMDRAASNIRRAHRELLPSAVECETEPGVIVGQRPDALGRVGVYAPGGRATYPSSVLMGAIPARVAGVREIVLCTPPSSDGEPSAVVLAAAALADVDRVFAVGGAGAVAAMAYGTESIPRVDRIVGPGNAFVAEAKLQVSGVVAIDSPAGPSELLVIADASCRPGRVADEMVAQAEHDPRACVVAVVIGEALADVVADALADAVARCARREIVLESLSANGGIVWATTVDEAVQFANTYAAEHVYVTASREDEILARLRGAGAVFLGASTSVAFGDYLTGGNHVLPTGGLARSYSGLSVLDFIRWTTYQRVSPAAARLLAPDVATFAIAEGLPGHAAAAESARGIS